MHQAIRRANVGPDHKTTGDAVRAAGARAVAPIAGQLSDEKAQVVLLRSNVLGRLTVAFRGGLKTTTAHTTVESDHGHADHVDDAQCIVERELRGAAEDTTNPTAFVEAGLCSAVAKIVEGVDESAWKDRRIFVRVPHWIVVEMLRLAHESKIVEIDLDLLSLCWHVPDVKPTGVDPLRAAPFSRC